MYHQNTPTLKKHHEHSIRLIKIIRAEINLLFGVHLPELDRLYRTASGGYPTWIPIFALIVGGLTLMPQTPLEGDIKKALLCKLGQ